MWQFKKVGDRELGFLLYSEVFIVGGEDKVIYTKNLSKGDKKNNKIKVYWFRDYR